MDNAEHKTSPVDPEVDAAPTRNIVTLYHPKKFFSSTRTIRYVGEVNEEGVPHGLGTSYAENGKPVCEAVWKNGKPHGHCIEYSPEAKLAIYHTGIRLRSGMDCLQSYLDLQDECDTLKAKLSIIEIDREYNVSYRKLLEERVRDLKNDKDTLHAHISTIQSGRASMNDALRYYMARCKELTDIINSK